MSEMGKYIYCIIEERENQNFSARNIGELPSLVQSIHFKDIGAVVSDTPIINYQLLSKNYLAHQKVIEESMTKDLNPLPVRFATIARNEQNIITILEKRYTEFKTHFEEVRGKKEVGLKVFWDSNIAYNEILRDDAQIRKMRDSLMQVPPEKSYFERIELGKMVEKALTDKRRREGEKITARLREEATDFRTGNIVGDKMLLNASFLVDAHQEKVFDDLISKLYDENEDRFLIKYVGPIPPYNFVEIKINLAELGLN